MKRNREMFLLSCVFTWLLLGGELLGARPPKIVGINAEDNFQMVARGENVTTMEKVVVLTDALGDELVSTNRYTILESGLNYLENGTWKTSEDVIESFPRGAVARKGPHTAVFSSDMNEESVFDIQTASGFRFRGGVRSIHLTDVGTGNSVLLGSVKDNVPGKVVPPNKVVYESAFDDIEADVVYVWTHNTFSQNVILRERVELNQKLDPRNSQLEVVTEVFVPEEPKISRVDLNRPGGAKQVDNAIIDWGTLVALPGKAFEYDDESSFALGAEALRQQEGLYVGKEWHVSDDGRTFIIESVEWEIAAGAMKDLPARKTAHLGPSKYRTIASTKTWDNSPGLEIDKPMELAVNKSIGEGLVVDLVTVPGSASSYTFNAGETYHVTGLAYLGSGNIIFEPGSVIKFSNNAYILAFGQTFFPDTRQTPIFTSKDDDSHGEKIAGSSGTPSFHANPALMLYYLNFTTNVKNAWFKWAKTGVEYFSNPGSGITHTIKDSLFQDCQTGVRLDTNSSVALTNVEKCDVAAPTSGSGLVSGTISNATTCVDSAFQALNSLDSVGTPSDNVGTIGLSHYVEATNSMIAVYDRSGNLIESKQLPDFYGLTPTVSVVDPRVIFDHSCQKWITCAVQKGAFGADLLIAISKGSSPVGLATNWTILNTSLGEPGFLLDYPTIGLDSNGVYIAVHLFDALSNPTSFKQRIVAIAKGNCLNGVTSTDVKIVPTSVTLGSIYSTIQPAINFDPVATNGYAWFVAKEPFVGGSSTPLTYGRVQWVGGVPDLVSGAWSSSISIPSDYFDMDNDSITFAPPSKSIINVTLPPIVMTGSRLQMAVIRDEMLWTTHHVGVNSSGGYSGTPSNATRSAAQWIRLNVNTSSLSYSGFGKVYDSSTNAPYWYYFPSLMVNDTGDMVIGFTGSRSNEYIGSFYSWRLANSSSAPRPLLLQPGVEVFSANRWGDYSGTFLDPTDDDVFWTTQGFAGVNGFRFGPSGLLSSSVAEIRIK